MLICSPPFVQSLAAVTKCSQVCPKGLCTYSTGAQSLLLQSWGPQALSSACDLHHLQPLATSHRPYG